MFVILFLSTAFFPENLLLEPARSVAEWNPLSFIVDGIRDLGDLDLLGAATSSRASRRWRSIGLFGFGLSAAAMRGRLRRG